jgi:hypothetical protein
LRHKRKDKPKQAPNKPLFTPFCPLFATFLPLKITIDNQWTREYKGKRVIMTAPKLIASWSLSLITRDIDTYDSYDSSFLKKREKNIWVKERKG